MKIGSVVLVALSLAFIAAGPAPAQMVGAGAVKLGVPPDDVKSVAEGWSAKKQMLGQAVFNQNKEKVGTIDDIIVASDGELAVAIIGAGGFAGLGRHDVAIPVEQLQLQDGKFLLEGATKAAIKALPKFEYGKAR